jgi:O-antigen/teichoic acid export membrane protein
MKWNIGSSLRFNLKSTTVRYSLITYLAISLNLLSGVLLARSIGVSQRGLLAYYANFLLLSSFIAAANIGNATARTLISQHNEKLKYYKLQYRYFILLGFIMAAIPTLIISNHVITKWDVNRNYFGVLMLINSIGAVTSIYDGFWKFNNSIQFITWSRFVGLAGPSLFTIILISTSNAKIEYLLLSQFIVIIFNLFTIAVFQQMKPLKQFPESRKILKSALYGFPTYLAEYLVSWIVPFLILQVDGAEVLGWYVIALSYALLADVSYSALEAKYYRSMSEAFKSNGIPPLKLLVRNSLPVIGLHLFFMPFVFLIPFIYGKDFFQSSIFAIVILTSRIPIAISRTITSYLISISRNTEPFVIFLSFIATYISLMTLTHFKLFKFHWIFAYLVAAMMMLLCAIILQIKLRHRK